MDSKGQPVARVRLGALKWCRRCSRKHLTGVPCGFVKIAVEAKSGRMVERFVHPEAPADD